MNFCQTCGREIDRGVTICPFCNPSRDLTRQNLSDDQTRQVPMAARLPPVQPAPTRGHPWVIVLAVVGFLVVLGGAGTAIAASLHSHASPPINSTVPTTGLGGGPGTTTAPAAIAKDPTYSPPTTAPDAAASVSVAPGVTDANAAAVQGSLVTYFTAIDSEQYQTAWDQLTPTEQAITQGDSEPRFASALATTQDSDVVITGMSLGADGTESVGLTFTSHQSPAESPDGASTCDNWSMVYSMAQVDGSAQWLIAKVASATPTAC